MNAPVIPAAILRHHVSAIEAKYQIKFLGRLPRGWAAHVFEEDALDFLAEKRDGLSLLGLSEAECALADLLGRPVGIVLISGLRGREAAEVHQALEPL